MTRYFILKETGLYWIQEVPEVPELPQQMTGLEYKKLMLEEIDKAILVQNQDDVKKWLLKALNWNPHPEEHRFELNTLYKLDNVTVEVKEFYSCKMWGKHNTFKKHCPHPEAFGCGRKTHSYAIVSPSNSERQPDEQIEADANALLIVKLLDLIDRAYHHMKFYPPDKTKMSYNEWQDILQHMEYYRSEYKPKKK